MKKGSHNSLDLFGHRVQDAAVIGDVMGEVLEYFTVCVFGTQTRSVSEGTREAMANLPKIRGSRPAVRSRSPFTRSKGSGRAAM
jgi:hypothetical protein